MISTRLQEIASRAGRTAVLAVMMVLLAAPHALGAPQVILDLDTYNAYYLEDQPNPDQPEQFLNTHRETSAPVRR